MGGGDSIKLHILRHTVLSTFINSQAVGETIKVFMTGGTNDLTNGWQNLNQLSHPNATLAPQVRQSRASGEKTM